MRRPFPPAGTQYLSVCHELPRAEAVVSGNSADAIPQAVHACGVLPGVRELEFAPRSKFSVPVVVLSEYSIALIQRD